MTTQEELTSGHWLTLSLDSCQLFVMTFELLRQETDHLVTTHTPTQVTTEAVDGGKLTNFMQLLGMTCELPRQETDNSVTTHTPTQVTTGSS